MIIHDYDTLSEGNVLRVEYTPIIMTKGGGFTFD
jgi:hypothetical protein